MQQPLGHALPLPEPSCEVPSVKVGGDLFPARKPANPWLATAPLALLVGVEDLAVRVTARWRDTVLPTITEHNGR